MTITTAKQPDKNKTLQAKHGNIHNWTAKKYDDDDGRKRPIDVNTECRLQTTNNLLVNHIARRYFATMHKQSEQKSAITNKKTEIGFLLWRFCFAKLNHCSFVNWALFSHWLSYKYSPMLPSYVSFRSHLWCKCVRMCACVHGACVISHELRFIWCTLHG